MALHVLVAPFALGLLALFTPQCTINYSLSVALIRGCRQLSIGVELVEQVEHLDEGVVVVAGGVVGSVVGVVGDVGFGVHFSGVKKKQTSLSFL